MIIQGYVYKFNNRFSNTTRRISKEDIQEQWDDKYAQADLYLPVTHDEAAVQKDLFEKPLKIDGYAKIELRDDGLYATIHTNGNTLDHYAKDFILDNFNLGIAVVCDTPSFYHDVLSNVTITHIVCGRFLTNNIYKPEVVITDEESETL